MTNKNFIVKCVLLLIALISVLAIVSSAGPPQFSAYWDNNGTQVSGGTGYFNVTITSTNGTVILTFNNVNHTASNASGDGTVFSVTLPSLATGTYTYNWSSYGDGLDTLYGISNTMSYTVNVTPDTTPPHFTNIADQSFLEGQSLSYDINAADNVAIGSFAINWTGTFSIVSSTGLLTNISALAARNYYINVSVNDTSGNMNSTILLINVGADTTAPIVTLVSPADDAVKSLSSTVAFTYTVTDTNIITSCSLIINGAADQTETSITKGTSQEFIKTLSNAVYNWSVNCTDGANNQGKSSTYVLTMNYGVTQIPSGGTDTTTPDAETPVTSGSDTNTTPTTPTDTGNSNTASQEGIYIWNAAINGVAELYKDLVALLKPYLEPYLVMSKPNKLWITTNVVLVLLILIVIWRLVKQFKKIRIRKFGEIDSRPRRKIEERAKKEEQHEKPEKPEIRVITIKTPEEEKPKKIKEKKTNEENIAKIKPPIELPRYPQKEEPEEVEEPVKQEMELAPIKMLSLRDTYVERQRIMPRIEERTRYIQREEIKKPRLKFRMQERQKIEKPAKEKTEKPEKKIIKKSKLIEGEYKGNTQQQVDKLSEKIRNLEMKQRIKVIEDMRKKIKDIRK